MSSNPSSTKKYRPYFTLPELEFLASAVRTSSVQENQVPPIDLLRYLERYIEDIRAGFREANHTLAPTISQRLELEDAPTSAPARKLDGAILYAAWQANCTLTIAELAAVQEYKYLNDLMTPAEEKAYEAKNGITY